jgi:broad specificity phosphatase PhoE
VTGAARRLFFIRHGETSWNREGRLQGQHDIPLNDLGRAQAEEAGRRLKTLVDPTALPWVASPLSRTVETARLARQAVGLEQDGFLRDDRLKELSFGRWEGLTWRDVRQSDPQRAALREKDKWQTEPPEGESYQLLSARLNPWLQSIAGDWIVVAHGGVARVLLHDVSQVDPHEAAEIDIWQGRVLVLEPGQFKWV